MLKYYKTEGNTIVESEALEAGCWVSAVAPTESEISLLETELGVDRDFIRSALDEEETSRIENEEGQTLIVLDYPVAEKPEPKANGKKHSRGRSEDDDAITYSTTPMSIILTLSNVITVSLRENPIVEDFANNVVKNVKTQFKTRFIFSIMLRIAGRYLQYLKQIDKISNYVEKQLHKSMKNKELIQLLGLEKSLVYFSTSLKSTETVLEKVLRGRVIKLYEEDQDLLEDVLIEVKQAIEMSNIYTNILSSTMETCGSLISNNLNIVMKVLTIITIVMEVPNIVFSFYGMNVEGLPYAGSIFFFFFFSAVLAVLAGIILSKSKFYK
ncbi:MAG: magnesium transporter CorA family protein [Ruminococcaceae bacterium]|nr:magnesium transporter CorA family protein [Oscillospiraceae bacterium]